MNAVKPRNRKVIMSIENFDQPNGRLSPYPISICLSRRSEMEVAS